jgi:hypothetical protein
MGPWRSTTFAAPSAGSSSRCPVRWPSPPIRRAARSMAPRAGRSFTMPMTFSKSSPRLNSGVRTPARGWRHHGHRHGPGTGVAHPLRRSDPDASRRARRSRGAPPAASPRQRTAVRPPVPYVGASRRAPQHLVEVRVELGVGGEEVGRGERLHDLEDLPHHRLKVRDGHPAASRLQRLPRLDEDADAGAADVLEPGQIEERRGHGGETRSADRDAGRASARFPCRGDHEARCDGRPSPPR